MAKNSGNNGYSSPGKAIESTISRATKAEANQAGLDMDLMSMSQTIELFLKTFKNLTNNAQVVSQDIEDSIQRISQGLANIDPTLPARQFQKLAGGIVSQEISSNPAYMKSMVQQRGTDPGLKGNIGSVISNNAIMHTHLLAEMNKSQLATNKILMDMMNAKPEEMTREEQLFSDLGDVIHDSIFKSRAMQRVGSLGTSLMNAGLYKIASSGAPPIIKQIAMGAVYLHIPEMLTTIIGSTFSILFQTWLRDSVTPLIANAWGNIASSQLGTAIGSAMPAIVSALPYIVAAVLAVGAIVALINGAKNHTENMKRVDKQIANDPTLTSEQRYEKRKEAHWGSGAAVGRLSGALGGAALGVVQGAMIGSAAGGIGAIPGAIIGGITGALAGLGIGHFLGGLIGLIKPVKDNIVQKIAPMIEKITEFFQGIKNFFQPVIDWVKHLFGIGKPSGGNGNGAPGTVNNPGTSIGLGRNLERFFDKGSTKYTKDDKGNAYLGGHLITSDYGWRKHPKTGSAMDGKQHFHKGIDLRYKEGEGVGAYVGGKVVFAGMGSKANGRSGYGNTVEIMDDNGVVHKYHHGQSIPQAILDAAKTGGRVNAGDVIMKAGKTGYATASHVDYETWQNKTAINPLEYLASLSDKLEEKDKNMSTPTDKSKNMSTPADKPKNMSTPADKDISQTGTFVAYLNSTNTIVNVGNSK